MTENATNMICMVLIRLFSCLSFVLSIALLFDFLLAIFFSLCQMFVKGGCHCLFKFLDGDWFHHI
jgi:hypothetical protein